MSIFRKAFRKKREEENGIPEEWEADEVFVRNEKGELVKLEVTDSGGEENAADDQKTQ